MNRRASARNKTFGDVQKRPLSESRWPRACLGVTLHIHHLAIVENGLIGRHGGDRPAGPVARIGRVFSKPMAPRSIA